MEVDFNPDRATLRYWRFMGKVSSPDAVALSSDIGDFRKKISIPTLQHCFIGDLSEEFLTWRRLFPQEITLYFVKKAQ